MSLATPTLYPHGQKNESFSNRVLMGWLAHGVLHSISCYYVPVIAQAYGPVWPNGITIGIWAVGTTAYSTVIITVCARIASTAAYLTLWHHFIYWGSVGLWWLYIITVSMVKPGNLNILLLDKQDNTYYLIYALATTGSFWFCLVLVPAINLLPVYAFQGIERWLYPKPHHIAQEQVAINGDVVGEKVNTTGTIRSHSESSSTPRVQPRIFRGTS